MADLTSREDERAAEQGRLKGQEEEKQRQRELDKAKEQSRKEGQEQERARQKEKRGPGALKIILYLIVLVIIIAAVAWFTLSVTVTNVAQPGTSMPFTTAYGVSFAEGQAITIGNTQISVLSYQNELISDIDGNRQKLVVGEDRVIAERRAVIKTLGAITLLDTHFEIDLKYKGELENRAYFDMAVHTSQQVPDILLRQLLPKEIDARPM
jgi:hypothetical protein